MSECITLSCCDLDIYQYVLNVPVPVVDFSADPTSGASALSVQFTDESTNNPNVWLWDFGDGETSTEKNPLHEYLIEGIYSVTLEATNESGTGEKTKSNYIIVNSGACSAQWPVSETGIPYSNATGAIADFTPISGTWATTANGLTCSSGAAPAIKNTLVRGQDFTFQCDALSTTSLNDLVIAFFDDNLSTAMLFNYNPRTSDNPGMAIGLKCSVSTAGAYDFSYASGSAASLLLPAWNELTRIVIVKSGTTVNFYVGYPAAAFPADYVLLSATSAVLGNFAYLGFSGFVSGGTVNYKDITVV